MKLINKIYLSIGFILITFCAVTIGYTRQTKKVEDNVEGVLSTTQVIKETETSQKLILDMETGLRGYMLTGNRNFLEPYFKGTQGFSRSVRALDSLTSGTPELRSLTQRIATDIDEWIVTFAQPLVQAKALENASPRHKARYDSLFQATVQLGTGKKIIDRARVRFAEIVAMEERIKQDRLAMMYHSLDLTNDIAIGLTMLAVMAGTVTALLLGSTIRRRFNRMKKLANTIAQGDYSVSLTDRHRDEISDLTTTLNLMAQQLKTSFSHLQKVNQELDQFAYIVSHDLKAPLRAINNLAEWIAEDIQSTDPDVLNNLSILRGRVLRMENLINGILDYAKIGRREIPLASFTAQEVISETIENLAIPPAFQVNLSPHLPALFGERTLFYQIFANLIGNALKYHHQASGVIDINYRELEDFHQFEVKDDGPGIPEEYHTRVFGIFQTMQARDVKESTGVGLAIVKKIIDEKGGRIWIESGPGQGASFFFTWPKESVLGPLPLLAS